MVELSQRLANLSPAKRRLLEQRLRKRTDVAEPVAIVGMACRFPGAPSLDAYWQLINEGIDATGEIPNSRWNVDELYDPTGEQKGKMSTRWAGMLTDHDQFDPLFFGISPREASQMDPQQRLLLEVAWEALEHAGLPAEKMSGSATGVFVGIAGTDYSKVPAQFEDYFEHIGAHTGTGNALSIAANRLSYVFDFHGPSMSVDTACSSGLIGMHLAIQSLRNRESDAALAGGVNMILTPETTIAFSSARMLSADGCCRPFDAGANGYVRGEGCGMVVLKRLTDAESNGDNILAVVRASAVNQDGRTSGITAPNALSQQRVIRAALAQAGLPADRVSYVEAHGTGTPLGDPMELQALGEVFRGTSSKQGPVRVSSVKANIGHTETASGIAGLLKVVLMLQHRRIPAQLHLNELNPNIQIAGTRLEIPVEPVPWPSDGQSRIAGVSSFGFGGTNAHVVLEEASSHPVERSAVEPPWHVLTMSAKTATALDHMVRKYQEFLVGNPDVTLADFCHTANTGRTHFNHRLAITAADRDQVRTRLDSAAGDKPAAGVQRAQVRIAIRPKIAMVFTGQGSQYIGMGRGLFESHPLFRETIERLDRTFYKAVGKPLLSVLYPNAEQGPLLDQTAYTQPALFSIEYALAQLWRSWGVEPAIVLGHSVGEYVACCVAGVFSPEDGLELIAHRARLMQQQQQIGRMAVVFAGSAQVEDALAEYRDLVDIAAANGPENTVISGESSVVEELLQQFAADGIESQPLAVSHAFHSPLMEPMLDEFEQLARVVPYARPRIPIVSNVTGKILDGEPPNAKYWRDHVRHTVRFADGMRQLANQGLDAILEVGPAASLLGMGKRCHPDLEVAWLPSLRRGQDDWQVMLDSLSKLYVLGVNVAWSEFDKPWARRRLSLPHYPFDRARHWYRAGEVRRRVTAGRRTDAVHPLLGCRIASPVDKAIYEHQWSNRSPNYLVDHQVQGSTVTPAAAYLDQALAAADQTYGDGPHVLENVSIQKAMFLADGASRLVQLTVAPELGGRRTFEIFSISADATEADANWTLHALGAIVPAQNSGDESAAVLPPVNLSEVRSRVVSTTSRDDFYARMDQRGLSYGSAFQVLDNLQRTDRDALAEVQLSDDVQQQLDQYRLHPSLLDALFQSMAGTVPLEADGSHSPYTYMPVGVRRVRVLRPLAKSMLTYAVRTSDDDHPSPETVDGDVLLVDEEGQVIVELQGVRVQRLGRLPQERPSEPRDWLYQVHWAQQPFPPLKNDQRTVDGTWLIYSDELGVGRLLANQLKQSGGRVVIISAGTKFTKLEVHNGDRAGYCVRPLEGKDIQCVLDDVFAADRDMPIHCAGVIHLWSLDISIDEHADPSALDTARELGPGSVLQLFQHLARFAWQETPGLWLVTRGAQPVEEADVLSPFQAPVWGLGRVASMEHVQQRCRLVDLDPRAEVSDMAQRLAAEMLSVSDAAEEDQIAFRGDRRCVARLESTPVVMPLEADARSVGVSTNSPFRLRLGTPGSFDSLWFESTSRRTPETGQVEVEVHAAGLNFSDVLKAMGLYPGLQDDIVPLGIECSGVVAGVGPEVDRFHVGDEVLGVAPYSFASHTISAEYALVHKPDDIDHIQASTIPITFLTAYYGLCRLAQLSAGERVLIHAGAGGVGLAAIQIARHVGAEIFATAGSDEKRDYLRSLGVDHVMNSRTLEFADEIMKATGREGVDVVLNSLPGDTITKSLESLSAYGRFLEIGKTDIYQNRMIGLLPFQDNLSYFAIDLDRMLRQRPAAIRQMFSETMQYFNAGDYQPLAQTQFSVDDTVDAFRYMAQRKNIGKVVISIKDRETTAANEPADQAGAVRDDGTYLITGGLGSLGLQVAEWLARNGAGHILLMSRRGAAGADDEQLQAIRNAGAEVAAIAGDVSDFDSLSKALSQRPPEYPPLRGVIHAAGVLVDGVLFDMEWDQFRAAMDVKVDGAWNLHRVTMDEPLDFFVMFSSVAALLGSPGQGNYAAGNAFLDSLAAYRRSIGRPAASINWGPWSGSGMAAEASRSDQIKSRGMDLLPADQALDILASVLSGDVTNLAVMDAHWSDMLRLLRGRRPAFLHQLTADIDDDSAAADSSNVDHQLRAELLAGDVDQRTRKLAAYIADELANIMSVDVVQLDREQPLNSLGLDSLMAMELKNKIESQLMLNLPMARFLEGPSISRLAEVAAESLVAGGGSSDTLQASTAQQIADWSPLLPLRSTGTLPPLFCVHPAGGDVRCYLDVARRLGDDLPVYVLRARGIEHQVAPHDSVQEMATDYLAAIRTVQSNGPYHFAGWSTGGIFAYEMTKQLREQEESVEMLIFIDSPTPAIFDDVDLDDDARFLYDVVNFSNYFAGAEMAVSYEKLRCQHPDERIRTVLDEAIKHQVVPPDVSTDHIRRLIDVCRAHSRAIMDYQPPKLAQEVHIFRPAETSVLMEASGQHISADLGWTPFVTERLNFFQVPGDHFSMMTGDNAACLAHLIRECLES